MNRREFLVGAASSVAVLSAQAQSGQQTFLAGVVAGAPPRPAGATATDPGGRGQAPTTDAARVEAWWRACDDCSRLGIHNVEKSTPPGPIVNTYGSRIAEFADEMAKRNLHLTGLATYTHSHRTDERQQMVDEHVRTARFIKAVGGRYVTELLAPGPELGNGDEESYRTVDVKALIGNLTEIGKQVHGETGLDLAYHPEAGDAKAGLVDRLLDGVDARYFKFFPDIGWMTMGGMDVAASFKKYRSRMIGAHLRDYAPATEPGRQGRMVPLGQGSVAIPQLVDYLRQNKFTGCLMAEGTGNEPNRDYMVSKLGLKL